MGSGITMKGYNETHEKIAGHYEDSLNAVRQHNYNAGYGGAIKPNSPTENYNDFINAANYGTKPNNAVPSVTNPANNAFNFMKPIQNYATNNIYNPMKGGFGDLKKGFGAFKNDFNSGGIKSLADAREATKSFWNAGGKTGLQAIGKAALPVAAGVGGVMLAKNMWDKHQRNKAMQRGYGQGMPMQGGYGYGYGPRGY